MVGFVNVLPGVALVPASRGSERMCAQRAPLAGRTRNARGGRGVVQRLAAEIETGSQAAAAGLQEQSLHGKEDESFITVTDAALQQLGKLLSSTPEAKVLRVGVRSGGCSGMSFVMDFESEEKVSKDDTMVKLLNGAVSVVCDPKSLLYLFGMKLDYSDALIGGGFKFTQPNATQNCGCGQSFAM
ncbi:Iron-sulfur assembly protein IscA, chloroplastic [Porphyridium purpureum]|uniref:Iron-sulfur assembly protein IscA, chloroplastic n=1 Tax=Porphyridium purpureum TaxID=35688 RepID=A0A5J4YZW3_PORPP|nr:Iron-sulfur assembly protein IscA, chloroplastic [Porphyridium purpureum]|eukprot:POR4104..scf209_3